MFLSAVNDGTSVKFYNGNTLVATHTTRVPTGNIDAGYWAINNKNTASVLAGIISSWNFEKFSGIQ